MTANKKRHHISRHGSALAAAAAAGVLVCLCCYRCNIHSCLKSLTLASEQLAAHQHNTSQLVNVSVCSMRGHRLEGVLIHRVLTGSGGHRHFQIALFHTTEFILKPGITTAHNCLCFYWFWCFIHPFYELKMCFVFYPPVCLLLYSSWWGSDSRWPVVLLHRLLSLWMQGVTARSCYRSEHSKNTQPYMTATTNIQRRDSGTFGVF